MPIVLPSSGDPRRADPSIAIMAKYNASKQIKLRIPKKAGILVD
jgi:hypothetical protein